MASFDSKMASFHVLERLTKFSLRTLVLTGLLSTTFYSSAHADISITDAATLTNPALDLAASIMGEGITIHSASYHGGGAQTGVFSLVPSGAGLPFGDDIISFDGGIIFSTGKANAVTGPNSANAGINAVGGIVDNPDFNSIAGSSTFNASWLEITFTPDVFGSIAVGDVGRITMNVVLGSEEYNSFVYAGVNDAMAIISEGQNRALAPNGLNFGIDTVNNAASYPPFNGDVMSDPNPKHTSTSFESANPSLYRNNSDNSLNTQMNGLTVTIPVTFDIKMGQPNSIKIGIADAGDFRNDSWLFVKGNSGQTVVVAEDDALTTAANAPYNIDVLANDFDRQGDTLEIIRINDKPINRGDTVTLFTGVTVTLENDGTLTVAGDGVNPADEIFTYEMTDTNSGSSIAYVDVTITEPDVTPPSPTISVNDITADNVINLAESGASISVTGSVAGEFYVGDPVTLLVDGGSFTGNVDTAGNYSIAVPGSNLVNDTTIDASVSSTDAAGNVGSGTTVHSHTVDITLPTLSVSIDNVTADNVLNINEAATTIDITGIVGNEFSAGDIVTLTINGSSFTGPVDVAGIYSIAVPGVDLVNDTTIDASVSSTDAAGNVGTGTSTHSHTVDTTVPTPSVSVDNVTADNVLNINEAATTIDVTGVVGNEFSTGDIVTLTINGSPFTGSVDAAGIYSIAVPGVDLVNDTTIDASVTSTDAAGNVGTGTSTHSHTVDSTLPTPSISVDNVTADNVLNINEAATTIDITGVVGNDFTAGDIVTLTINGNPFTGAVDVAGIYSIAVPGVDLVNDTTIDASVSSTDVAGNVGTSTATHSHTVNSTLPTPSISVDNVTADNVLNINEAATTIDVTGVVGNEFSAGDSVTLTINGSTFTGPVDAAGNYSIPVSGSDLEADTTIEANISTTNLAGNTGTGTTTHSHTIDSNVSAVPTVTALTSEQSSPVITGTAVLQVGDVLTVSVGGGVWTVIPDGNGDWSLNFNTGIPDSGTFDPDIDAIPNDVAAVITNSVGNESPDITSGELVIDNLNTSNDSGSVLNTLGGIAIPNVLANDSLEGGTALIADVTLIQLSTSHSGVILNAVRGSVDVLIGVTEDTHKLMYEVCERANPTNCETATATVFVDGDADRDGVGDFKDLDKDNDGIPDLVEQATAQNGGDTDGDGRLDELDLDADGDGISDLAESGLNPTQIAQLDSDNNGVIDSQKGSNGLADALETDDTFNAQLLNAPVNSDADSQPDFQDLDSDNDSVHDLNEGSRLDPVIYDANNDGVLDDITTDADLDGIPDSIDADKSNIGGLGYNLVDIDSDGVADIRDLDSDGDGSSDLLETQLVDSQTADTDGDGVLDNPTVDSNSDGIPDSAGVSGNIFGEPQATRPVDTDQDNYPDYQDLDSDNDSLPDSLEAGNQDDNNDGLLDTNGFVNPTLKDTDNDGTPDYLDEDSDNNGFSDISATMYALMDTNNDGHADNLIDIDNDGIPDVIDGEPGIYGTGIDLDRDFIPNSVDLDDDNDGLPDLAELGPDGKDIDTDEDGNVDRLDRDSDNDGIPDSVEAIPGVIVVDEDGDGVIDNYTDSNGDGLHDNVSFYVTAVDSDNDDIPDFRDIDSDNDNLTDFFEASWGDVVDAKLKGQLNSITDIDHDGLADEVDTDVEGATNGIALENPDSDFDGIFDFRDTDSDDDGLTDEEESEPGINEPKDDNANNVHDYLEVLAQLPGGDGGVIKTAPTGSGGSFGFNSLLLLLLLLAVKQYHSLSHQRRKSLLMVCSLSGCVALSGEVHSMCGNGTLEGAFDESCLYAGGGLVSSHVAPEGKADGWHTTDDSDKGVNFFAGYKINEHWFSELALTNMGKAGLSNSDTGEKGSISYIIPSLHVGYLQPTIIPQLGVYGKAGVSAIQNDAEPSSIPYEKETNIQLSYGIGAQWQSPTSPLFARLGADFHDTDARATSVSLGYQFGAKRKAVPEAKPIPAALPIMRPVAPAQVVMKVAPHDTDGDGFPDTTDYCPLSKRGAKVDNRGCEINLPAPTFSGVLEGVNFHTGSANLTLNAQSILKNVANQFQRWPDLKAVIVGHTDNVGSNSNNMLLSQQRAHSVRTFLVQNGVKNSSILAAIGKGERNPRASNSHAEGRALNRRVELLPR
ncbi:MAG: internalin, putative [uncultured Thiotrichaceae bacterium]|uniref:Internalin, putative n=1 Tax=uncultured Thiotrichaceae bacterium TaxID=298394 RepID=A0A6S6S7K0_9GAMM|nr:MAG: internalin, putative [uncultured Thiotrichaceae bacterium]